MMEQRLQSGLAALNLPVEGIPALVRYGDLLIETNKVMNLTAITDPEDVATLHFLDSAALLTLESFSGKSVVDVGTGAGFPGLPLRVLEPSIRLTLLDSLNKRIQFLETVCRELDLPDVACVHARAEEFAAEHRETFDLAVSRAVAALPVLCELCLPLVRVGGSFIAMKGPSGREELAASGSDATARETTVSKPSRSSPPSPPSSSALPLTARNPSSPRRSAPSATYAIFFAVLSSAVIRRSGRTIASGRAGKPPPVPTSQTAQPCGRYGATAAESVKCFAIISSRLRMAVTFSRLPSSSI